MTSLGEIREQLTGPGGAFEVTTDVVNGVEMKVYKDRMGSLREVAQAAANRGDQEFIVQGDQRFTYGDFVRQANSVAAALARDAGVGHGDRVAVLSANNAEWCLAFWATVDLGAILVGLNGWWKTDEILYGLDDSGAKVLVADAKRFERIADQLDLAPGLERIYLIDADPADFDDPRIHRFDELLAKPTDEFP
ncbi:MAG: AMP-binding protein, partial [Acidimicrobiales bacterium]